MKRSRVVGQLRILESVLESKCVKLAKEQGWRAKKMNTMFDNHWPDRMFIQPVKSKRQYIGTYECNFPIFFVEFKREGEELTAMQEQTILDLKRRGQRAFKIDTYEAFVKLLHTATG